MIFISSGKSHEARYNGFITVIHVSLDCQINFKIVNHRSRKLKLQSRYFCGLDFADRKPRDEKIIKEFSQRDNKS